MRPPRSGKKGHPHPSHVDSTTTDMNHIYITPSATPVYPQYSNLWPVAEPQPSPYPSITVIPPVSGWESCSPNPYPWAPIACGSSTSIASSCGCERPNTWVRECKCGKKGLKPSLLTKLARRWSERQEHREEVAKAEYERRRTHRKVKSIEAEIPLTRPGSDRRLNVYMDLREAQEELIAKEAREFELKESRRRRRASS
jgi:hypothetical protein